jgi:hypothetical protein
VPHPIIGHVLCLTRETTGCGGPRSSVRRDSIGRFDPVRLCKISGQATKGRSWCALVVRRSVAATPMAIPRMAARDASAHAAILRGQPGVRRLPAVPRPKPAEPRGALAGPPLDPAGPEAPPGRPFLALVVRG